MDIGELARERMGRARFERHRGLNQTEIERLEIEIKRIEAERMAVIPWIESGKTEVENMTVIVGIIGEDEEVHMGADSFVGQGDIRGMLKEPKVFRASNDMGVGVTGTLRLANVVRKMDYTDITIDTFPDVLRYACRDAGLLSDENGVQTIEGRLLIGYQGCLYGIDGDFATMTYSDYTAIGIGKRSR